MPARARVVIDVLMAAPPVPDPDEHGPGSAGDTVPPPNKHELALMIWIAVVPILTALNLILQGTLDDLPIVIRTLILVTIAVPIVIYVAVPILHRLRNRLIRGLRGSRRRGTSSGRRTQSGRVKR